MNERLRELRDWLVSTYRTEEFYEVCKTACAEIAVLLFVFPLIDMLGKDDAANRKWFLPAASVIVGFVFILIAGRFSRAEAEEKSRKQEDEL